MRSLIFRVLGGSLLTVAIVWALILGWWQSIDHQPDGLELGLYLGVLPLAQVGGYWLLRGFIEHLAKVPQVGPPANAQLKDADPLSGTHSSNAAAEREFALQLINAFVVSAGGDTGEAILAAIDAGKRPEPSDSLLDSDGFPVFVASVSEFDGATIGDELLVDKTLPASFARRPDILRALGLLDDVLVRTAEQAAALFERHPRKLKLHLLWLVPAAWGAGHHDWLRGWLSARAWPSQMAASLEISLIPAVTDADSLKLLDEVILTANRDASLEQLIVLTGAVSAVDEQSVDAWASERRLFSVAHQDRQIPGEGAVALLLATRSMCAMLDVTESVTVTRLGHGVRDKAVTGGGRISGRLIEDLAAGVMRVSGTQPSDVKAVISDTDHRASHLTELLEGLGAAFEHLEPMKDCLAAGTVTGALEPIGSLVALSCARDKVLATEGPVLCLSNQHASERTALLAIPCSPAAAADSRNSC